MEVKDGVLAAASEHGDSDYTSGMATRELQGAWLNTSWSHVANIG